MSTVAYKCPNCACPMNYDGVSGKMTCPACGKKSWQKKVISKD